MVVPPPSHTALVHHHHSLILFFAIFTSFNFVSHLFFSHLILLVFNLKFYEVYDCDVDLVLFSLNLIMGKILIDDLSIIIN